MNIRAASLAIVLATAVVAPAAAAPVRHVPPAEAVADADLELFAEAPATTPALSLHYRPPGTAAFAAIELVRRDDRHWVAVIPAAAVGVPGLEYYLAAAGEPVFASPTSPHTMPVIATATSARRARDLVRSGGRRSRVHTSFEWVNYGTRTVAGTRLVDRYYRVDADFSYQLWAYPLEELRVGYTRLLGDTASASCPDPTRPCTEQAGFKVAGWFELGLAPAEGVRFDGRLMVMATQSGFRPGGRGEARLGVRDANHVALGVEYLADVGTSGFFRLGWASVPELPMAATVEITALPDEDRDTGVRFYYDVARGFGHGVRAGVRIGYAARVQSVAGFTSGAHASVDF